MKYFVQAWGVGADGKHVLLDQQRIHSTTTVKESMDVAQATVLPIARASAQAERVEPDTIYVAWGARDD